jgi:AsmA protein
MGKLLKFLAWLVGFLVLFTLAAIVLLPMFVDPNQHKERIITEVKKATGRDLTISGDIGLSVFPWLALELNGLSLSNAPGFDGSKFAAVEHAQVRVNLIPLITKQTLEVDTVHIQGLDLNLAKSKQGVTNWEDITARGEAAQHERHKESDAGGEGMPVGLAGFAIGGVAIKDARVVWQDMGTGERYELRELNLETGALSPGKPVDVSLALGLDSQKPAMQARLGLKSTMLADDAGKTLNLNDLQINLKVTGEGLPKQGVEARLESSIYLNHEHGLLKIKDLSISSGQLVVKGEVSGKDVLNKPVVEGNLDLQPLNLRQWMKAFGLSVPTTADPEVLKKAGMSTDFKYTSGAVSLDKLKLSLDETKVNGSLELVNFDDPLTKFNLDLDQINLDRYLPPSAEVPEGAAQAAQQEEPLFPVETLRQFNLDGVLRIKSLTLKKVKAEAIQVKLVAKRGDLKIEQQVGRFYDGLIKGEMALDVRSNTPKLKINQSVSRVLAGPLLQDLADTDKLEGTGDFTANLTSSGNTLGQLKRGLNGTMQFSFLDGAVKGVNLARMLREAKAKFSAETVPITNEPEQTDFSELGGSAVIQNGILNNRDLLAKSPFLRVEGAGKVNLVTESLDYTVRSVLVSTPKGQGGEGMEELVGVPIPVRLKGAWSDPQWNVDLAKVLEERQKAKLKEKVDEKIQEKLPELQEKLPESLKEKLPGALKGLF